MRYNTIFHIDDAQDEIDFFACRVEPLCKAASCFSFTDATDAFQKLISREILPDVIFFDLNMPLKSGREFLLELKSSKRLVDIPVAILSTSSDFYTIQDLKSNGAFDFITKPSEIKELENLLLPYIIISL